MYVTDGDLAIDNNAAERALREIAVGRRNSYDLLSRVRLDIVSTPSKEVSPEECRTSPEKEQPSVRFREPSSRILCFDHSSQSEAALSTETIMG